MFCFPVCIIFFSGLVMLSKVQAIVESTAVFESIGKPDTDFCNIAELPISFLIGNDSLPNQPVVFRGDPMRQYELMQAAARDKLLDLYGSTTVILSSSNAYSHDKLTSTLSHYIRTSVDTSSRLANETFYLFGNNYEGIWKTLADLYVSPPCSYCEQAGAKTIGLGGESSGVAFHLHGPGYSETVIGRKRWFLFPPSVTNLVNKFDPNMTVAQWVDHTYPLLFNSSSSSSSSSSSTGRSNTDSNELGISGKHSIISDWDAGVSLSTSTSSLLVPPTPGVLSASELSALRAHLYECTLTPGDILYFPAMWMHATLNVDAYNVFMSVFIDPQLIAPV